MDTKETTGTLTQDEHGTEPVAEPAAETTGNKSWKEDPKTLKLTSELSKLRREQDALREANEKARRDSEIAKAEEQGRLKEELERERKEREADKLAHHKELLTRDLKLEMNKQNFADEYFIDAKVGVYKEEEHGSIKDYVAALKLDEANAKYLSGANPRTGPVIPPGKLPSGGSMAGVSAAQIRAMQNSGDAAQRSEARRFLTEYLGKHGKLPEGID